MRTHLGFHGALLVLAAATGCTDNSQDDGGSSSGGPTSSSTTDDPTVTSAPTTTEQPTTMGDDTTTGDGTTSGDASSSSDGSSSTDGGSSSDGSSSTDGSSSSGDSGSTSAGIEESDVGVVWSNEVSFDFCLYYSGPPVLGDEATWQASGDDITLVFPHVTIDVLEADFDPIYSGTLEDAELVLQGVIEHEFNDAPWQTTETFTGTYEGGVFTGSYIYEECDPAVPEMCPGDGFCTITADFVMTLE